MNKPKTRKLFTVSVLALLLVSMFAGLGVWQIKPAQATTIFSSGWENSGGTDVTDGGLWSGVMAGGTPNVTVTPVHHGSYAINATSAYDTYNMMCHTGLSAATNFRFYTLFTNVPTDGQYVGIAYFRSSANSTFLRLRLANTTNVLNWHIWYKDDGGAEYTQTYNTSATINCWQAIEIQWIATATGSMKVYENGTEILASISPLAFSVRTVGQFCLGTYGSFTTAYKHYFDCVKVGNVYVGLEGGADSYPLYSVYGPINQFCTVSTDIVIYSNWDDNDGVSTYAIQHNNTGVSANTTGAFSGFWANATITLNAVECVVAVKIFANDTSNQWTATPTFYIYVLNEGDYGHEIRGMFIHEATLNGGSNNYTAIAENIAHYNFTDVYFGWGASTYINPYAPPTQATIDIFHGYGLKVHYCMAVLGSSISNDSWKMETWEGVPYSWICPTKTSSRTAIKVFVEQVAANFTFDGVMFDYCRYDIADTCYCSECRAAFETWLGEGTITDWTPFYPAGERWLEYAEWRIIPVTTLVHDIEAWMTAIRPTLSFSAAVFSNWDDVAIYWRKWIGQDTGDWIKQDYLDVVAPMMYSQNPNSFESSLQGNIKYFSDKIHLLPFLNVGSGISVENFTLEIELVRAYGMRGFVLWRYGGAGDTSSNTNITVYLEAITVPETFSIYNIQAIPTSATSATISWDTNITTLGIVEYATSSLFTYTWTLNLGFYYWQINHVQGTLSINMTRDTHHSFTLTGLPEDATIYYRCVSYGSGNYTSLMDTIVLSGFAVTITSPTNTTYTSSSLSVQLSASGGTIDKIWWNCTFTNGTVVYANTVYTVPTSMTLANGSYIFNARANNTLGEWDEETVTFTVAIPSGGSCIADAYVRNDAPYINYGSDSSLYVTGEMAWIARTFLNFSIASIPEDTSYVYLRVYAYMVLWAGQQNVSRVVGAWTESGITWYNQPSVNVTHSMNVLSGGGSVGWVTFNVTDMFKDAKGLGLSYLSMRITMTTENSYFDNEIAYRSKEYGFDVPRLVYDEGLSVMVTVTSPTNTTYISSTISVQISASGGTIDVIWWNCKNGSSWIYGSNITYTTPTSMTGFINGTSYTFYAWANNTYGNSDEETMGFSVTISVVIIVVTSPTNSTYSSSSVSVNFDATGGFPIDKKWFNCTFSNGTLVYTNTIYTVPITMTLGNGSYVFNAMANNTYGTLGASTVMFTVQIVTVNHYYFNFGFYDLDSNDVENKVTWQLYNSSQLLSYTEGQTTLISGTYTLRTCRYTSLISQTNYATATYGNTTINVYLQLKAYAYGYLAFNNTVTSLILDSQSMYNLTFTITGEVPTTMTIDFPYSPTLIFKDGVNQTDWTYTSGYIVLTATSLSVWQILYSPTVIPPIFFPKGGYYYFITGTRTTNNVTGYRLDPNSGWVLTTITQVNAGNCTVSYAFQVSIIKHDGSLIDVTGITAVITRSDIGEGFQNGYASISTTQLVLGYQAIRVRLYIRFDSGAWYASGDFVTEILIEKAIDMSTWNFTVYTKRLLTANGTWALFIFGDQSHNSRIGNVAFIDPLAQEIALWKLESGDIIGGMLYPFMLYTGDLIYGLGIMFVSGVLYLRHKKWEVILTFFLLYAGGAGIGYLIPDVAYRLVYIVIWFVLTIVLYRVFR